MVVKNRILLVLLASILQLCYSQTFTEIDDYGFGVSISPLAQKFCDFDNDGLLDLLQSDYDGYFLHFEESESNSLVFYKSSQNPFDSLIMRGNTFADLDNDGWIDMFDSYNNRIRHFEQHLENSYVFDMLSSNFNSMFIDDEWSFSPPSFFDVDNDTLLDMFMYVCHRFEGAAGQVYYELFYYHYEQSPTNTSDFDLINDEMFGSMASAFRDSPVFADVDNDAKVDMFLRSIGENITHFEQTEENSYEFDLITSSFCDINTQGDFSIFDIDSDNLLDIIISKGDYKLQRFEQQNENSYDFQETDEILINVIDVGTRSFPAISDINNDGLLDLLIGNGDYDSDFESSLFHYQQIEPGSFEFELQTDNFDDISGNNFCGPSMFDIDNDNLMDLLICNYGGSFTHYEQVSSNSLDFELVSENFSNIQEGFYSSAAFADFDNDSLLDMLVGDFYGWLHHYEQESINSNSFILVSHGFNEIWGGCRSKPCLTDFDQDNLVDLFIGGETGQIRHYEQVSQGSLDFELIELQLADIDIGYSSVPVVCDVDQNGTNDLLIGSIGGGLYLYSQDPVSADPNITLSSSTLYQNYPNPFNPSTTIECNLMKDERITLTIYTIKGEKIRTVVDEVVTRGTRTYQWDGTDEEGNAVCSGVYLYRLDAGGKTASVKRCVLLK